MKLLNKITLLLIIICISIMTISFAEDENIEIIKIGLQYSSTEENTKKNEVVIKNVNGFEFGKIESDKYIKEFDFDALVNFSFVKDNLYHVQLGAFSSYSEALKFKTKTVLGGMFIVKGEYYYVYADSFSSINSANDAVNTIFNKTGVKGFVTKLNSHLITIKSNSKIVFAFDSSKGDFLLAPKNVSLTGSVSQFGSTSYRGGFGAKRLNTNDITLINYVRMNEYLYGVVPSEMPGLWPIEALKAQAIVARNFALTNINKFSNYGFNLDGTINSQAYKGYDWEFPTSNQAVDETVGLKLKYGNELVSAYYHSNSGGYTENSENVWSSEVPYIKGRFDPYSIGVDNGNWTLNYTASDVQNVVSNLGYDIGVLKDFYIQEYTPNNRVFKTVFVGSKDTVVIDKQKIRFAFNHEVKSTLLTVHPNNEITLTDGSAFYTKKPKGLTVIDANGKQSLISDTMVVYNGYATKTVNLTPDSYEIRGSGSGHGLGMSQWGAKIMAEQGLTFEDILTYYYTGTHIE